MKYRRLTADELANLEKEFINFLVANTITGDDWQRMKGSDPAKAEGLIDIFSDMVFETTLKNVSYLQFATPKDLKIFACGSDNIRLIGLSVPEEHSLNFTQDIDEALLQKYATEISIYKAEKNYQPNREQELFRMLEQGCRITNGTLFDTLDKAVG